MLAAPIALHLLDLIQWVDDLERISDTELIDLAVRACVLSSPHWADHSERLNALRAKADPLAPAAAWLAGRVGTWWRGFARERQVLVTAGIAEPVANRGSYDLEPFHRNVTKPRQAQWTSTAVVGARPAWLAWLAGGEDRRPGPHHLWRMHVPPGARVFEVDSPADWADLALRYGAAGPRVDPDWNAVATEWDGVHVSFRGLLTTQGVVREISAGMSAELRGWDVESTVWLRWSFDRMEYAGSVDG